MTQLDRHEEVIVTSESEFDNIRTIRRTTGDRYLLHAAIAAHAMIEMDHEIAYHEARCDR
ncbi:MAG: hypothetical protein A3H97_09000 [Acidobacteria bacterium RIFCSPLOWO2_02_FULL_65_29]|nr:MAG: hypothetical protein A3H97_09000 [Acidobacteria bacterium RIFCSPLOWO2_02_FULL_65_29]